jgi:4-hydroxy-tetrahydrodipicolinate synthase
LNLKIIERALVNSQQYLKRGLWGIVATPFSSPNFIIDTNSLRKEISLFSSIGASGVVALGVFGEGAALNSSEQIEVVKTVIDEANGLPIVVGISERTTATAIEQASEILAVAHGQISALMVQVNTPSPQALIKHLHQIYNQTKIGIVLQDYPVVSGVKISVNQILETVAECPFIVAIKSESPPTSQAIAGLSAKTDIPIFGGLGGVGLLDELAAGAAGAMTGFSFPEGLLETLNAWNLSGIDAAREAFSKWLPLANFEAQPGIALAIRKELLKLRGVFNESIVRAPAPEFPEILRPMLMSHLDAAQIILSKMKG